MVKIQKSDDIRTREVPSTRVLYRNPNIRLKIPQSAIANDVQKDKTKNSNLIVKKINKVEKLKKERKDVSIETDHCILRRICQEKGRKKMKRKSKLKLPTLAAQNSSMVVLKIKHKPRNNDEVPKICTEEDEDIVIDNLRMLMNKYLDKHMIEDDEVMTKIKSSFRAVLNRLTAPNVNVLTPSLCKLDKSSRSSTPLSMILNRLDKEIKEENEESTDKYANDSKISKSNMFVILPETAMGDTNRKSNAVVVNVSSDVDENKPNIVSKKVKLKKIEKDQNTILVCQNSFLSTATFEVLVISRKSLERMVEDFKKGSINMTRPKIKIDNREPDREKSFLSKKADHANKREVNNDIVDREMLLKKPVKNKSSKSMAIEDVVDYHIGLDKKEINVEGFSNALTKDSIVEETEMQDEDEDILSLMNEDASEKTVNFFVEPIKDASSEMDVSDGIVRSLYGNCADENCHIMINKNNKKSPRMLKKSFRSKIESRRRKIEDIQRSKVKRAIAVRKTKKNNKTTRKNECCVLRIDCHKRKFTGENLIKQLKKVNVFLSNYKAEGNSLLDIVVKVHSQNKKIQSTLKDIKSNFVIEVLKDEVEGNTTIASLLADSDDLKKPDVIEIVQKGTKKKGDFPTVRITEAEPFTNNKNIESDIGNHILENPIKYNIKTDQNQVYAAINRIRIDLQNSLKSVEIINNALLSKEKLNTFVTQANAKNIDLFNAINNDKQSCNESNQIMRTMRDDEDFVPKRTENNIMADVIELLDTSLSHDKYLQDINKSNEIIKTNICNEENLTSIVNETNCKIIAGDLQLLMKSVSHNKHLRNYCKSDPNLAIVHKSNLLFPTINSNIDENATKKRHSYSQEPEMGHKLYLTAAAKDSYEAYEKERAKRIPRNDTLINYPCLGMGTYGESMCVEDVGYFITIFSSASEGMSKDSDDISCVYRKASSVYQEPSKREVRNLGDKQSVGTQITTSFPKQTKCPKAAKKTQSYKIIESESVIKVTDMTSGTKYLNNINNGSINAKATTCSLPNSRAIFELVGIDNVNKSEVDSFISKEITQRKWGEQMLVGNTVTEAYIPSSSQVDAEDDSTKYKQDEIFSCNDFACSHSAVDTVDRISRTYDAKHLSYFLTTKNHKRELQSAIEMESPIEQKFEYQTVHVTKIQAFFCCSMLFLLLAIIVFYFLYVHIYNPGIKAKFKLTKTIIRSTTPLFDQKEMGFR